MEITVKYIHLPPRVQKNSVNYMFMGFFVAIQSTIEAFPIMPI